MKSEARREIRAERRAAGIDHKASGSLDELARKVRITHEDMTDEELAAIWGLEIA